MKTLSAVFFLNKLKIAEDESAFIIQKFVTQNNYVVSFIQTLIFIREESIP